MTDETSSTGLRFDYVDGIVVRDVAVSGFTHGIAVSHSRGGVISNCNISAAPQPKPSHDDIRELVLTIIAEAGANKVAKADVDSIQKSLATGSKSGLIDSLRAILKKMPSPERVQTLIGLVDRFL